MDTAIINLKIDKKTKSKAQKLAEEFGYSLTGIITSYLKEFIETRKLSFERPEEDLELTDYAKRMLKKSEENFKKGEYVAFDNPEDALKYLDTFIADSTAKKKSHLR